MTLPHSEGGSVERHTAVRPCRVCGGHPGLPRRKGVRCHGFRSSDHDYIHCTRENFAGGLPLNASRNTYAHRADGPCNCGVSHGDSMPRSNSRSQQKSARKPDKPRFVSLDALLAFYKKNPPSGFAFDAHYVYKDEKRQHALVVVRFSNPHEATDKTFRQGTPIGSGWQASAKGARLVPFKLPELRAATLAGDTIYIVEGEKDVLSVMNAGGVATCNPMGAGKDVKQYVEHFRGAGLVRIVADRDDVGWKHANAWADALRPVAKRVEVREPVVGKDAHDALVEHGHDLADAFVRAVDEDFAPLQHLTRRYGPNFPTHALPDTLRAMVERLAEAMQIPAEVVATWAIGVLSACVARKFEARVRDGWKEPLNVFAVAALPPANRKSGALRALIDPLSEYETNHNDEQREEREAGAQRIRLMERRLKKAENRHADAGDDTEAEAYAAASEARKALGEAKQSAVQVLTLFTGDTTPEAAAALMEINDERLACISAEGDEFFALMRRYSGDGAANQDFYLKAHAGDHHRIHRKTSASIDLEHPALSLVLAVQPTVIDSIRTDEELRRRGMIARILYAVPKPLLGHRKIGAEPVPANVAAQYSHVVRRLLDESSERVAIDFDNDADGLVRDFEAELEPKLGEGGELEDISDWAGKLAGLIVRGAGILHCVEAAEQNQHPNAARVSAATVVRAIEIGRWALEHAWVALGDSRESDPQAEKIWKWVTRRFNPLESFSARDAFDKTRVRNGVQATTNVGLNGLVERGYLRFLPKPPAGSKGGRPPAAEYLPNPDAIDTE